MSENQPVGEHGGDAQLPEVVMAYVSVTSPGSILEREPPTTAKPYRSDKQHVADARKLVEEHQLAVIAESRLGLAVAGPPEQFERLTGSTLVRVERQFHAEAGQRREVTHLDFAGEHGLGVGVPTGGPGPIEAVILEQPRLALAEPSARPPATSRYHLRVPDDVALLLGAVGAHRCGYAGNGIRIAMVDSGHYAHPFFRDHGYAVERTETVVPSTDRRIDPVGHGTGESANIFALAPGATLLPYRASDEAGRLVGAVAGFMLAKQATPKPHIITNSWGGDGVFPRQGTQERSEQPAMEPYERAFAAEILDAIDREILVVFAAGNGSYSVEPQVQGVLSAGGVFVDAAGRMSASDYASGYASPFYPRNVPDVCGLVGQRPRAQYLMLPVPPGCQIDVEEAQGRPGDPPDGTAPDDGWALFSGTSAAAPQAAGAAALVMEANPQLTPRQVRDILIETAEDVGAGSGHPRFNAYARGGPDVATGNGLLCASRAVEQALALSTAPESS